MSAAWLLPCDRSGTVSPGWLDDDPERRERVEGFRPNAVAEFEGGRRVARLPGEEQPHVWIGTIVLGAEQLIYLGTANGSRWLTRRTTRTAAWASVRGCSPMAFGSFGC